LADLIGKSLNWLYKWLPYLSSSYLSVIVHSSAFQLSANRRPNLPALQGNQPVQVGVNFISQLVWSLDTLSLRPGLHNFDPFQCDSIRSDATLDDFHIRVSAQWKI